MSRSTLCNALLATAFLVTAIPFATAEGDAAKATGSATTPAADQKLGLEKDGPELDKTMDYYAAMTTNHGVVVIKLYPEKAPKTVRNFVNLAEGTKAFKDPSTRRTVTRPFYDHLIFHRVIPGFMIQGGDPLGSGAGDPGYKFVDEFDSSLSFSKDGLLAMANSGPNTNGCQFFITDKGSMPAHLNNHHTIFGEVVQGLTVVNEIANVKRVNDRPVDPVVIAHMQILRVPAGTDASKKPWEGKIEAVKDTASVKNTTQGDVVEKIKKTDLPTKKLKALETIRDGESETAKEVTPK